MTDASLPSTPTEQFDFCPKTSVAVKPPGANRRMRIARPNLSSTTRKTYSGMRDRDLQNWAGQLLRRKLDDLIDGRGEQNDEEDLGARDHENDAGDEGGTQQRTSGAHEPPTAATNTRVHDEERARLNEGTKSSTTGTRRVTKRRSNAEEKLETSKVRRSSRLQKQN
ncbi:hypothetical protein GUITHDRAFT_153934 [Guillardia theta CCMP2712]|uniref:Uncharacterized protein n=2 Tax=Guillardia theta TaxID=55529 RepID=L1IYE3_GUITC|nr:hypothetical protein GUITHDRAFT_153934 [Guillardia theta CCMP2712]EKX41132.1 hypothetical protein GUITHDRAFT_153934 [Guillardia theta CCMP2712]|mmetsp:Transcript_44569/g.140654  ORF Transcript_44569/g.140654 Transcript_44569/m.140654 type:complete len:167 (+) Transcript_44569:559-1059(+)|eukprot:XP_005828112.1 hypothetical protein GUITHDRAFT_153934 [Guillardia theta CCMP2712]